MAAVRELPLASYPSGRRTIVRQTPNGLAGFRVAIARCTSLNPTIWPDPDSRIRIEVENSFDGGASFPEDAGGASCELAGGIVVKRGIELDEDVFACSFKPDEPTAVRITVEIINGPIRTSADVTIG